MGVFKLSNIKYIKKKTMTLEENLIQALSPHMDISNLKNDIVEFLENDNLFKECIRLTAVKNGGEQLDRVLIDRGLMPDTGDDASEATLSISDDDGESDSDETFSIMDDDIDEFDIADDKFYTDDDKFYIDDFPEANLGTGQNTPQLLVQGSGDTIDYYTECYLPFFNEAINGNRPLYHIFHGVRYYLLVKHNIYLFNISSCTKTYTGDFVELTNDVGFDIEHVNYVINEIYQHSENIKIIPFNIKNIEIYHARDKQNST